MESYIKLVLSLVCSIYFLVEISRGQLLPIVDELGNSTSALAQVYIVHVQKPQGAGLLSRKQLRAWHQSFLPNKTLDSGEPRLLYSYRDAISGFAALLTSEEVKEIEGMEGFLMAQPDKVYPLATTYTPQFLGLSQLGGGAWYDSTFQGQGIVIGVLDTGIVNDHPSFSDDGMPPKPTKWSGSCLTSSQITCNNKLIGAAGFIRKFPVVSAVDTDGHGTHVASTAGGNFVTDASVLGSALGTASGTAPRAHLAMYKVCNPLCPGSSVLAGIEKAISDKVDIISLSIGGSSKEFDLDNVALGSMGAYLKGILPVVAAGNDGPGRSNLSHEAPWALTVGAIVTDRRIRATVRLGNGKEYHGESAFQPSSFDSSVMLPIVWPGENGNDDAYCCKNGSLANIDVKGKIVICAECLVKEVEKGKEVYANGGAAMLVMNIPAQGYTTDSAPHWLPASHLASRDVIEILHYFMADRNNATATIEFGGTIFGHRPAPAAASFTSRGPPIKNGGILKPDVVAPGVSILAAWHEEVGRNPTGTLKKKFNFDSGTSMACPHVSGIVALIKSKHPSWVPSAIQSAIITSANNLDLDGNPIRDEQNNEADIFAVGAGLVNASKALDPGLVYIIDNNDYTGYVCGLGIYNNRRASAILHQTVDCSKVKKIEAYNLNYPSIGLDIKASSQPVTTQRTVTNVGDAMSTYRARITQPAGLKVDLSTYDLTFKRLNEEISFDITFTVTSGLGTNQTSSGRLEWISGKHVVASPIAINWL